MEKTVYGIKVECVKGDIASQEVFTAVVNAANAQLQRGGGVAGAIHRAAGPGLEEECISLAPIKPGEAVITGGHNLPNKYVIHCLGPIYGVNKPENELLASCYREALDLAEENGIDSIAFPSLSTGAFGFPLNEAAQIAFKTIREMIPHLENVKRIRFVLYDDRGLEAHQKAFASILED